MYSDNLPVSIDKLLACAYMIGVDHGVEEKRHHDLQCTIEKMAEQLSQILDRVQALKHEDPPSQVEEAEALHPLRSGKVVDNGVGSKAQGEATNKEESMTT